MREQAEVRDAGHASAELVEHVVNVDGRVEGGGEAKTFKEHGVDRIRLLLTWRDGMP